MEKTFEANLHGCGSMFVFRGVCFASLCTVDFSILNAQYLIYCYNIQLQILNHTKAIIATPRKTNMDTQMAIFEAGDTFYKP